ncbi:MAG: ATP-binding protein, partial [Planctomycetota bacterium]
AGDALYLATATTGLFRLKAGEWQQWTTGKAEATNNVFSVLERRDGTIWVGTQGGLLRAEQDTLVKIGPQGPVVNRPVYFLVQDHDHRIWLGTDNGVLRWDGEALIHYTIQDGLAGRETNRAAGWVDSRNRVWIGTDRGVSVYRSELDRRPRTPPHAELLHFEASGHPYALTQEAELQHDQSTLIFHFRAISFLDETRVQVRSWLEGLEPDWLPPSTAPTRELRYTHLPPGRYRLHIKAANADGMWSEIVTSAPIIIHRPFWQQPWFPVLSLALLAALGFALQHHLTRKRRARREELSKLERLEALGHLAGGIAHDFNNLLTIMLGNLGLLKLDGELSPQSETNLVNTDIAIQRARDLTQQLLTFSRGGAPVRHPASIAEVIEESASFVLRGLKVCCEINLPEKLWLVDVDSGQMSQVINNLLINAGEAMPEGGTVYITGRNLDRPPSPLGPGRVVEITIRDQGFGIAQEHLGRIFDPYYSTKHRGSGLGLATAYSIVSRHKGLLTVESTIGQGATFRIYLPASRAKVSLPPPKAKKSALANERILVMDDEEQVRELLGALLTRLGYSVEFAADGSQAIDQYRQAIQRGTPFHLVIMDLMVPGGMGGCEAVQLLLKLDPDARVVVLSGYCNDPVMADYRRYGLRGCVSKPFDLEQLAQVLWEVIHEAKLKTP